MPDGSADIERLADALEVLADQLAATRATLDGLRIGAAAADPAASSRPAGPQPATGSTPPAGPRPSAAPAPAPPPLAAEVPGVGDPWAPHPADAGVTELPTARRAAAAEADVAAEAAAAPTTVPRSQVASLDGVPLLSAGFVEAVVGPISDLDELDTVEAHISRFDGVVGVTVHRLEHADALLLVELAQPTALADMLREDLGRPVASCRLAEGRIVVEFAPE